MSKRVKPVPRVVWLTGLPGSGKSTMAYAMAASYRDAGYQAVVLDGDGVRAGLCADLGFTAEDRCENVRRLGAVAKLLQSQGLTVFVASISPIAESRAQVRALFEIGEFVEVYCQSSLAICCQRDPKGLYAQARAGIIAEFTGVSSPYEAPQHPEIILPTGDESVEASLARLMQALGAAKDCKASAQPPVKP